MYKKYFTGMILFLCAVSMAAEKLDNPKNHYMEWGIGVSNLSAYRNSPLDAARYDWSIIDLGNIPCNKDTVEFLNRILEINPKHKFLLRVWPINHLGKCSDNRYMMTIFDYFYRGKRDKVLQETREQVNLFMNGLSNPENIVAICFLEELPLHISSYPWLWWKKGDPVPWDIKAFSAEIEKDLGAPFDMMNPEHRLWWGKRYARMINDFHLEIKKASGGKKVFYWHISSMLGTLDNLKEGDPIINQLGQSPAPIYYKDIVKPGLCDGIFGYPGNRMDERCVIPAKELKCLYFLQVSSPTFMRSLKMDKIMELAMNKDTQNVGLFFFDSPEQGAGAWHQLPWKKDKECTRLRSARMFAYSYKIGMPVIEKELKPEIKLDYKIDGLKKGDFARVFIQIFNPVSPSWYGGNAEEASFKNIRIKLEVPPGFEVPPENNPPMPLKIGDMKPYEAIAQDWWVRKTTDDTVKNPCFKAILTWNGGNTAAQSKNADEQINPCQPHFAVNSEEKWIEPAYRTDCMSPAVQIIPFSQNLVTPELISDNYTIKYNDILHHDEILTIGPGLKAELRPKPLFNEKISAFGSDNADGTVFDKGYNVYNTPQVLVSSGKKYLFRLTGKAEGGGNCIVLITFTCGKEKKELKVFENKFGTELKTLETEITVPQFNDKGQVSMALYFYRLNKKGTVIYKDFSFTNEEQPKEVTSKLQGSLRPLEKFFTLWQFKDDSKPDYHGKPKAVIRFLNPEKENEAKNSTALPFF